MPQLTVQENFHDRACFETNFPRPSMIQAKTYMLIFCLMQANFIRLSKDASQKFSINLQRNMSAAIAFFFKKFLLESWNIFRARFAKYVQSNFYYGDNLFISRIFSF